MHVAELLSPEPVVFPCTDSFHIALAHAVLFRTGHRVAGNAVEASVEAMCTSMENRSSFISRSIFIIVLLVLLEVQFIESAQGFSPRSDVVITLSCLEIDQGGVDVHISVMLLRLIDRLSHTWACHH